MSKFETIARIDDMLSIQTINKRIWSYVKKEMEKILNRSFALRDIDDLFKVENDSIEISALSLKYAIMRRSEWFSFEFTT